MKMWHHYAEHTVLCYTNNFETSQVVTHLRHNSQFLIIILSDLYISIKSLSKVNKDSNSYSPLILIMNQLIYQICYC